MDKTQTRELPEGTTRSQASEASPRSKPQSRPAQTRSDVWESKQISFHVFF